MRSRLLLFAPIALVVFLMHAPLLRLPFYWDELGQFVPASLDLFHSGAWVPYSTVPNVHPPAVMAYLAGVWSIAGFSIPVTRIAMLLAASAGALVVFLLAIELGRNAPGMPAFLALALLCFSPLFVSQAMLAQLDMPAMLFTSLALLLFLKERIAMSAAACCMLVMVKETGIMMPVVLGGWLLFERRRRDALWFALPLLPLALWLAVLKRATGHLFGSTEFTDYNLLYPLNPVRLALALGRRCYYLFASTCHFVGSLALLAAWRRGMFRERGWRIAGVFVAAQIALVSVLGGAVLERYLLPALPLVLIAFAVAFETCSARVRMAGRIALPCALLAANFVNPPYPFPLENNLAFATFVSLHADAAGFLQANFAESKIATAFPLASALRRPEFGYVAQPLSVRELKDFRAARVDAVRAGDAGVLVLYSTTWDPLRLERIPFWAEIMRRYYAFEPQIKSAEAGPRLGMQRVARWAKNGQWVEVFAK